MVQTTDTKLNNETVICVLGQKEIYKYFGINKEQRIQEFEFETGNREVDPRSSRKNGFLTRCYLAHILRNGLDPNCHFCVHSEHHPDPVKEDNEFLERLYHSY